jgi:hypothetical protein
MDKLGLPFASPAHSTIQPAHQPAPPQPSTGATGGATSEHPARRLSADYGRALLNRNISEHGKSRTALAKRFRILIDADPELKQTFVYYKGMQIVEEVENAGAAIDLPQALVASLPAMKQGAHYAMKRKEIRGKEFAILYEISKGQVVNAAVADRALLEAVDAYHQNVENREQTTTLASDDRPATPGQASDVLTPAAAPESSASSARRYGKGLRTELSAPPQPSTFASDFTAFSPFPEPALSSGDSTSTPGPESVADTETDKAAHDTVFQESRTVLSDESGSASRRSPSYSSSRPRTSSGANTPGTKARLATALFQRLLIEKLEKQRADGMYTDSRGMLTPNAIHSASRNSPAARTPAAESILSLSSIEDVVSDEEKLISGVAFAQRMESLLEVHLPEKTGAVKLTKGKQKSSAYEPSWQDRLKTGYDLTQEHCFMAAWLDALGDELTARDIDMQRDRIDIKLQEAGGNLKDLDEALRMAADNALIYGVYQTLGEHGPGVVYERIGSFFEEKKAPLKHFKPKAGETFGLLYEVFEQVPGFQDLKPELRFRFIVDPRKIDLLKRDKYLKHGDSQLLMFLCDYDSEYAYKVASGIPVAMDKSTPVGPDLFIAVHHAVAAGSTDYHSGTQEIGSGLSEKGMKFALLDGIHLTKDGERELREFSDEIERLKAAFREQHPELEFPSAMEKRSVNITRSPEFDGVEYERGWVSEDFLRFCLEQKTDECMAVINDEALPVRERKAAAIRLCKFGENLHPFADGNGRVFEMLMLQRLYHDIDGSLPMPKYPGVMDGHSIAELLDIYDVASEESSQWKKPELLQAEAE